MTALPKNKRLEIPPIAVLSHRTAMEYYRTLDPSHPKAAHPTKAFPLAQASASSELLRTFNSEYSGFGGRPINLLVPSKNLAHASKDVVAHSCRSELPGNSFWKLTDTLYVSSPELCFVQMAQTMSVPQIAELGVNLCADYHVDVKADKLPKRRPITTPAKLASYAERASGMKGAKKARQALKWVVAGSRSPMETKTFILLCLPRSRGGYGLGLAKLNHRVDPGRYAYLAEQGFFRVDLCWPEPIVGVEYYGDEVHLDNVVHDRRRLDALEALGWNMVVIDKQRLYDPESFDIAARQVADYLNHRIRKTDDWIAANLSLRKDLGL